LGTEVLVLLFIIGNYWYFHPSSHLCGKKF